MNSKLPLGTKLKMIFKGFKFGMLLQFAVGPVCIFIFQMASLRGFYIAETGVLGVALIDGIFIGAAIIGIASLINKRNVQSSFKVLGAVILFLFGLSTILSQFDINFLPSLSIQNVSNSRSVFLSAIILTASNPLTIIFWQGVFFSKILEEKMKRKDMCQFGVGSVLSTLFFLTFIALVGSFAKAFLPAYVIQILNIIVGSLLIYFSIKMIIKKRKI